jgi:hypothetical protein
MGKPRFWLFLVFAGILWYFYEIHKDNINSFYTQTYGNLYRGGYFFIGAILIYLLFFNKEFVSSVFKNIAALDNDPRFNRVNIIHPSGDYRNPGNHTKYKRNVSALLKKKVAASQQWKCTSCKNILDETYEVDHIIALEHGGSNDPSNLRALCPHCHRKKTVEERLR